MYDELCDIYAAGQYCEILYLVCIVVKEFNDK